jgi:hypothetical protein
MTMRSIPQLTIVCATALTALFVAILAFHAMPKGTVILLTFAAVAGIGLMVMGAAIFSQHNQGMPGHDQLSQGTLGAAGQAEPADGSAGEFRRLAEEYRRLSDLAITAQEHSDLKLSEVSAQLDHLRGQVESLRRILSEVE